MQRVKMTGTIREGVTRSALGLAAAVVMGAVVGANAQLPVTNGLIVWLKADAVNTGDTANQVRISGSDIFVKQWNDQSGNSHNAANGTEADQPLYIAGGLNGMPVLRFGQDDDDNGDRLYLGDLSASFPTAGSVFTVSTLDNDGRYNLFGNRNNNDERWVASNWNESRPGSFRNNRSTHSSFALGDWPQAGSHVFSLESSTASFRIVIDGAEIGSDAPDYNSGNGSNWTIANRSTGGQQLRGDIPEMILFNRTLTPNEGAFIGRYLADKYGVTSAYPALPTAAPAAPTDVTATPQAGAVSLSWTASAQATSHIVKRAPASGGTFVTLATTAEAVTTFLDLTGNLGQTYYYVVTAVNFMGEGAASVEASAARLAGTGKDMLTFSFGALGESTISGTNILKNVPLATDVTALAPTYTVSFQASSDPVYPSGTARNFTTPQTYLVISEAGLTNTYVVKVIKTPPALTYDFNSGLQGWTQIWPAPPATGLWDNGHLGQGDDGSPTRFGRSPEFYLNNLGDMTFQFEGGQSPLAAPGVAPSLIPETPINGGGFAGAALREVATDTYVLSKRRNGSDFGMQGNSFTAAELAPYANNGKKYTLDYIDYNSGGWGWTYMDNVAIPGTLVMPIITGMTLPPYDPAVIVGNAITLRVPYGLNMAALELSYTMSPTAPFASGLPSSGAPADFTSGPVNYTLVSEDLLMTNVYTVTVVVLPNPSDALVGHWVSFAESLTNSSGYTPVGTHDGIAVGNTGGLSYSPDVPPGFAGSSLDLTAGGVGVMINNSATLDAGYLNTFDDGISNQFTVAFWAKGLPGSWSPWVSKQGEDGAGWQLRRMDISNYSGFTLRGVNNDDGWGSAININDTPAKWHHFAGVWDQATGTRTLYVDGVFSHVVNNPIGQMMALAANRRVVLGGRQYSDDGFGNYFQGLLYDVRIYKQALFSNQVQTVMTTPTVPQSPEANVTTFGIPGSWQATISTSTRSIHWIVPFSTDLTALAPVFTLSSGATCDKVSGVTRDFSKPQTYTVTSSDSLVTAVYTVRIKTGWDFNDGSLQGWHNRVWDLSANSGAGGWVDLAPNVTAMPESINGGVIQPTPADNNQIFGINGGTVFPVPSVNGGNNDYHLNTLWLRSPEFYLNRTGDLTVQLARGITRTATAPANDLSVPYASTLGGGWMGVALRRVSDGAFVLVKPKTDGPNDTYYTTTFTQAELAPYAGSKAYTLEIINADSGEWGWLTMDNAYIPGSSMSSVPLGTLIVVQ